MKKKYWIIRVTCWGTVLFEGSEEQAEAFRRHKATWEACVAVKSEIHQFIFDELRKAKLFPVLKQKGKSWITKDD